jgi:hypothetical protein
MAIHFSGKVDQPSSASRESPTIPSGRISFHHSLIHPARRSIFFFSKKKNVFEFS